jgi:hypothetical protein
MKWQKQKATGQRINPIAVEHHFTILAETPTGLLVARLSSHRKSMPPHDYDFVS